MEIDKNEFFRRKIFLRHKLQQIKEEYPDLNVEIDKWWTSPEFIDEYDSIQEAKSFLMNKIKEDCVQRKLDYIYDGNLLYRLFTWYNNVEQVCHYCGLRADELEQLRNSATVPYINGRYPMRGKSLELDRKIPKTPYEYINNLVLACYWCNNAKTDTFSYTEFKAIGAAIGEVWRHRLANK